MRRTIRRTILTAAIAATLPLSAAAPARAATVLVKPGRLDHFVLTAPPSALAGESFLVRVEPYDASGNLLTATDSLARRSTSAYDALNRVLQVTDPAGGVTRYSYDAGGNLAQVTDPRNVSTRYVAILVEAVLGLVVLPFNVAHLGRSAYGLWMIAASDIEAAYATISPRSKAAAAIPPSPTGRNV